MSQIEALSTAQEQGWKDRIAPAVEKVGPGTWAIPVPIPDNPLVYTYCYVLAEDKGFSLIDPGWGGAPRVARLEDGLREIGCDLSDINGIAITHYHQDHLGMVPELMARKPDMWVAMQRNDLQAVGGFLAAQRGGHDTKTVLPDIVGMYGVPEERRGELTWSRGSDSGEAAGFWEKAAGSAHRSSGEQGSDTAQESDAAHGSTTVSKERADRPQWGFKMPSSVVVLDDDDALPLSGRTVKGVWTPGHTFGHTAFIDDELGAFFSGDHLLPKITPNIGLDAGSLSHSLKDYLGSLEKMQGLDDSLQVLPAHGFRFAGLHVRAKEIAAHHADRLDEVRARMAATEDHSVYSIAQGLHWSRGFEALHDFNLYAALQETAAHMHYLDLPVGN